MRAVLSFRSEVLLLCLDAACRLAASVAFFVVPRRLTFGASRMLAPAPVTIAFRPITSFLTEDGWLVGRQIAALAAPPPLPIAGGGRLTRDGQRWFGGRAI